MQVFTNQAQLSYGNVTTNSNVAKGEIVEVLSATKTALTKDYFVNDEKTYVINIMNSGTTAFSGLTLSDNLGKYSFTPEGGTQTDLYPLDYIEGSVKYYQNGVLQSAPVVVTTNGLEIQGINVPAQGSVIIVYTAKVNEYAPLGVEDTIQNTVTIQGTGLSAPIEVTETINTLDGPYLTITKSVCPKRVSENGEITYTFDIRNIGNEAAATEDNVMITDTFNPILSNITVYYNNDTMATDAYTYDQNTGQFAINAGQITIEAAQYTQDSVTGKWDIIPGEATLEVVGRI